MKKFLLCLFLLTSSLFFGQVYNMTTTTTTTTAGNFYDSGGSGANYTNSSNLVQTFTSTNGYRFSFFINNFVLSPGDSLYMYEGTSNTGNPKFRLGGTILGNPTFWSKNSSVTFEFISDASTNSTGWDISISTLTPSLLSINQSLLKKGKAYSVSISGDKTTFTGNTPGKQVYIRNGTDSIAGTNLNAINDSLLWVKFTPPCGASIATYTLFTKGYGMGIVQLDNAITLQPYSTTITTNSITCFGSCTGSATSNNVNGTPPYTYAWNTGPTTQNINSLCAGTYTLISNDSANCSFSSTAIITQPTSLSQSINSGAICAGDSYTLTSTPTGGNPPYTYLWNTTATTQSITVNPGSTTSYTCTVTDVNGCTHVVVGTVTVNTNPFVTVNSPSFCAGGNAALTAGGATTYSWSPGIGLSGTTGPSVTCSAASSTSYTITGTSAAGCTNTAVSNVTVNALPALSPTTSHDSICVGGICNLFMNPVGATTYNWAPGGFTSMNATVNPVTTTIYTASATSAGGCVATGTVQITVLISPSISFIPTNVACFGFANGAVVATPANATAPISYLWNNGATTNSLSNITAGSYSVTITDKFGCQASNSQLITEPGQINIAFTVNNVNCGQTNGSISANVTNGTAPYNYFWSNGDQAALADSLTPGLYQLNVVDNNGCQGVNSTNVVAANGPVITLGAITNASCFGGNDGGITTSISGGTAPVDIQWSTGVQTANITNLAAGLYDVVATDAAGCSVQASYSVSQPPQMMISHTLGAPACGASNGTINTTTSGGAGGYTFLWSANAASATTPNVNSLPAGIYTITVTDANLCAANKIISLANTGGNIGILLDSILSSNCVASPAGFIGVSIGGNAPPYTHLWNNGATTEDMSSATPGTYQILVTDNALCNQVAAYNVPSKIAGYQPQICMVSVDDITNLNYVVWDKTPGYGVNKFNIYRETSSQGVYLKVAQVAYDSLSRFNDTVANTNTHSWRYKISAEDSCGNETALSDFQKTIHRVIVPRAATNTVDLYWDFYDGAVFSKYYIYRELGMNWQLIDSVASNVLNYTDLTPPNLTSDYLIEADLAQVCIPTMRLANHSELQFTLTKTRSNIKNNRINGIISGKPVNEFTAKVYPNPATNDLTIMLAKDCNNCNMQIVNTFGQTMMNEKLSSLENKINISNIENGIYYVKIISENKQTFLQKVIVQK